MLESERHRGESLSEVIARSYELEWEDQFEGDELDSSRWLPYYLPQWSSRKQSAARYELGEGRLRLLIEHGQPPWCPELDGATRVSSLQTGLFAGAVGTESGQHRFASQAVVREKQQNVRLFTPQYGVFALRAQALDDPSTMVALWMIGYEERPERSAEICICEIFGKNVGQSSAGVGMGVHPFGDPLVVDDFETVQLSIDARELHEYAAEWAPGHVSFFVDDSLVRRVAQSPHYPMQFMLGIYEFGDQEAPVHAYPKAFTVDWFRAFRPR